MQLLQLTIFWFLIDNHKVFIRWRFDWYCNPSEPLVFIQMKVSGSSTLLSPYLAHTFFPKFLPRVPSIVCYYTRPGKSFCCLSLTFRHNFILTLDKAGCMNCTIVHGPRFTAFHFNIKCVACYEHHCVPAFAGQMKATLQLLLSQTVSNFNLHKKYAYSY